MYLGRYESNPAWVNIRVVVIDKDFKGEDVLAEAFLNARQILCQFHVIGYLGRQRDHVKKEEVISALQLMMKVESSSTYTAYRQDVMRSLGNDKKDPFLTYFDTNCETYKDEWVGYLRDSLVPLFPRFDAKWTQVERFLLCTRAVLPSALSALVCW
ncbi:hypothetical protein JG687_00015905 [Phytophthora cactorum]|uniref:ZSWIM1/3 RNaseH-like domain-containing protein n=1 Tax=Phytophthora cactorum TaxID=29920 RepID=A0A8T1TS29_9STRA|nr:hypothetical protein GQ600_15777 [Phytophthora cactorum]KAG6947752.1 hypothetical protein JG687_00015905 [Phytophthora cactorum]